MLKCKLQLRNSILGRGLFPVDGECKSILDKLYGSDYDKLKRSEVCCMKNDVQACLAHIRSVANSYGLKVSVCGSKHAPTLRFFARKEMEDKPTEEVSVDLRYSMWSDEQAMWEEFAPGVWEKMRNAFEGKSGPITIHTNPKKEIYHGTVTIFKGKACGALTTEWDDPESLAGTLGVPCDEAFIDSIPFTAENMAPGIGWNFKIKARSFQALVKKIDRGEGELIKQDENEWDLLAKSVSQTKSELQ
jgi:hypothetical protein